MLRFLLSSPSLVGNINSSRLFNELFVNAMNVGDSSHLIVLLINKFFHKRMTVVSFVCFHAIFLTQLFTCQQTHVKENMRDCANCEAARMSLSEDNELLCKHFRSLSIITCANLNFWMVTIFLLNTTTILTVRGGDM